MHSRKKVPKDESKEKERMQKATKFAAAFSKLMQLKSSGCRDQNLLNGIADLLYASPDFYTLWNYRREIFICLKENLPTLSMENKLKSDEVECEPTESEIKWEAFDKLCKNELSFIENCLKVNYKSYGTWHHRSWLVSFMSDPPLEREIQLCNQFLKMDERNFHCWNYRRFVVKLANIDTIQELEFSNEKINDNFSNFSSWYYRSSLLRRLYASGHDPTAIQSIIDTDYGRIQEAIYTDPSDQSVWLYLRWLFSVYSKGLDSLLPAKRLCSANVKRFIFTSLSTGDEFLFAIEFFELPRNQQIIFLKINDISVQLQQLISANGTIWYTLASFPNGFQEAEYRFEISLSFNLKIEPTLMVTFKHSPQTTNHFVCFVYTFKSKVEESSAKKIDMDKFESLKSLYELEPDNKWVNYTLAWLESNDDIANEVIEKLIQIDRLRMNYYKDLRSKIVLRKFLSTQNDLSHNLHLTMSGLNLHSLRDTNQLMHLQYLDLSGNKLIKLGVTFSPLVSLRCLILDQNLIYLIDNKLQLPNLTILSLSGNRISKCQMVEIILSNCAKLKHVILFHNPLLDDEAFDNWAQMQVENRDLAVYWKRPTDFDAIISNVIAQELELIRGRQANEIVHIQ